MREKWCEKKQRQALIDSGLLNSPPIPELDELVEKLAKHYQVASAWVALPSEHEEVYLSTYGFSRGRTEQNPVNYSVKKDAAFYQRDIPLIIGDCRNHPVYQNASYVLSGETAFMCWVAVRDQAGIAIASLGIEDPSPRESFNLSDTVFLKDSVTRVRSILNLL